MGGQVYFDPRLIEDQVDAHLAVATVHGLNVRIGQQGAHGRTPESHLNASPYFSIGSLFANPSHVSVVFVNVRLEGPEPANDSAGSHSPGNALRSSGLRGVCREPSQTNGLAIVSNPDVPGPDIPAIHKRRADTGRDKFLTAPLDEFIEERLRSLVWRGFAPRGNVAEDHSNCSCNYNVTNRVLSHMSMMGYEASTVNVGGGSNGVWLLSSSDEE